MEAVNLGAESRESSGKGAARKLRSAGRIPAVVYRGGSAASHITVRPNELELAMRRSGNRNTLFTITTDGQERTCIVKAVQRHPLTRRILHVDFYELQLDEQLVVTVLVQAVGRAAGTRLGGTLKQLRRFVNVRCLPADIPAFISVDVSHLEVNDLIRASQVSTPEGVELVYDADFNLFTVQGRMELAGEEEEGEDEETEGEGAGEEQPSAE